MLDSIRTGTRRRALGALLAATALTAGAAATTTALAQAQPPAGHAAATVAWSKVGSGWIVATWQRTAKSGATVYLVAPGGTRYALTGVSNGTRVIDWTTLRGGRVLVENSLGVREIDLRTGARHTIGGLKDAEVWGYARPAATSLYATVDFGAKEHLARIGLDGKRLGNFPSSVSGSGAIADFADPVATRTTSDVVVGARHGLVVFSASGKVVRRLLPTAGECEADSLLRRGIVVARCDRGALYAVPLAGGRATRLTDATSKENPFGYTDLWSYSRGRLGISPNGCGPSSLVRYSAQGHGTRIYPTAPVSGTGAEDYLGHYRDVVEATFHHGQCMSQATTLFAWNAVTGHSTALLGPGVNGGDVTSVAPSAFDRVSG